MRKVFSIIIASMMLATTPIMAAESTATAELPKVLTDLGITAEDLSDIGPGVADEATSSEADLYRRGGRRGDGRHDGRHDGNDRYCPRGYRLEAYRVRIGRFVIVRYRCVRRGHHRPYNLEQQQSVQQPEVQQTID